MQHRLLILARLMLSMLALTWLAVPARADLVSEWLFNEASGTTAYDSVGGINGTLMGNATFVAGAGPGQGIYSGAVSMSTLGGGYVTMGNVYPFTTGDFSLSVWVKTTDTTDGMAAVTHHHTDFNDGYFIGLNNVGDGLANSGSHFYASDYGAVSSKNVEDGSWHLLTTVYQASGGAMSYYVDGTLAGTGTDSIGIVANNAPFLVGGIWNGNGTSGPNTGGSPISLYNGLISDVRVYNNALTADQVMAIYQTVSVPEPASAALLGLGVIGLGSVEALRRRATRRRFFLRAIR